MKLNKNYLQTLIFLAVYLFGIYFWSQPLQDRKLPYGEYDAMSHFEVADYMSYNDRSFINLPPYIDLRYGMDNRFKPHTLWYPPPFHTALGIMESISGDRVVPVFLLNTIMASFIIITAYFVVNSLFGFLPAILSSLLLIFSPRDFMPYLWGQWPERFGYAFIPIILYCFYRYCTEKEKPIYAYLTALLLGINIWIHPLAFFHSVFGLIVLYIFLSIKQKRFIFSFRHFSIAAIIFLILFFMFPYQTFNIFPQLFNKPAASGNPQSSFDFSRLFQWSLNPKDYAGSVPESYFSFGQMHGLWTLPFLLIGILFLLWRREEKDLLMLAWLVSLYLVLHRDILGKASFLHRSLSASAHIFAPLAAIGAVYLSSFVKLPYNFNKLLKYGLAAVFIYFAISVNMALASNILTKNTYNPYTNDGFFVSLNNEEYLAAQWVLVNVPKEYNITIIGIPYQDNFVSATAKKIRWMGAASQHVTRFYYLLLNKEDVIKSQQWYVMMDYTMIGPMKDQNTFNAMQLFEKEMLINHTIVYNQNNIRVFKLDPKKI